MGTLGLFRVAKTLFPYMVKRGNGSLIATSSTASIRGNRGQHSHAAAMGARRVCVCASVACVRNGARERCGGMECMRAQWGASAR